MPAQEWVALARNEERVARALEILGLREVRWTDLYHLLELVKADGRRLVVDERWATRAELERFSRTANSPAVLGPASRHGVQRGEPPANPMAFDDAHALIFGLVRSWLEWKVARA